MIKLLKLINKKREFLSFPNLKYHLEKFTERSHSVRNELTELFANLLHKCSDENRFSLSSNEEIESWGLFLCLAYQFIYEACLAHTSSACKHNKSGIIVVSLTLQFPKFGHFAFSIIEFLHRILRL